MRWRFSGSNGMGIGGRKAHRRGLAVFVTAAISALVMFFGSGAAYADTLVEYFKVSTPDWYRGTTVYDGNFELTFQYDGNLVLYRLSDWHPMWATGTEHSFGGHGPAYRIDWSAGGAIFFYSQDGTEGCAIYNPYASALGGRAMLQDDGNFVVYNTSNHPTWASNTWGGRQGTVAECGLGA